MCGIIGTWNIEKNPYFVKENIKCIEKRGPDNTGILQVGNTEFGHTRLAIQDLSNEGNQPMCKLEDDGEIEVMITYNGELWNSKDIINLISDKKENYKPKTSCDTEIILDYYYYCCRNNLRALNQLNGMFALAIKDTLYNNNILFRDCVGEKPLYYTKDCFCSKQFPLSKSKKYDNDSFMCLLGLGYSNKIFEDVKCLEPGEIWINGEVNVIQDIERSFNESTYYDFVCNFKQSLFNKIENMDVPFAICLSGGLDSSLILAETKEMFPNKKITTITIGFDEKDEDVQNSRLIAKKYETNHHELFIDKNDLIKRIPDLVNHIDIPIELGSMLPTFVIAETIKQKLPTIKVVLLGEGADEMFFGYKRHSEAAKSEQPFEYFKRITKFNLTTSNETLSLEKIREFDINSELVDYHMKRIDMIFSEFGIETRCPFLTKDLLQIAINSDPEENIYDGENKIWIRNRLKELKVPSLIYRQKKRPLKLFPNMDEIRSKIILEFNKRCKNAQQKKN